MGSIDLADQRDMLPLREPAQGTIGEYVAFYLGPYSPMLLRIITGHRVIQKIPQRDIVYLLVRFADVVTAQLPYVITDGHASDRLLTRTFITSDGLSHVDSELVMAQRWNNTEQDWDRERRKQAEVLVHGHVPPHLVSAIGVYDEERFNEVSHLVAELQHPARVKVDTGRKLFYP